MSYSYSANNPVSDSLLFSNYTSGIAYQYSNTTIGSILYMHLFFTSGSTLNSISDSAGNSWTIVGPGTNNAGWVPWGAYCLNNTSYSGNDYVTPVISSASANGYIVFGGELIGGPATSLLGASNENTGTSASPSVTLSGVAAGSAIVATVVNNNAATPSSGSGYTGTGGNNGTYGYISEYNTGLSSGSGSIAATASMTSGAWNIIAMAFNPLGGGGGLPLQAGILT